MNVKSELSRALLAEDVNEVKLNDKTNNAQFNNVFKNVMKLIINF